MVSIIVVHAAFFKFETGSFNEVALDLSVLQLFKFGTICFFMISGYLLGGQIDTVRPGLYFRRRLDNTLLPWMLWAGLYALLMLGSNLLVGATSARDTVSALNTVLFGTAYWFIPNFLLALGVLLLCRPVLDRPWFGLLLGLCSLLYGVNVYFHVVEAGHTAALFGFVFYLWLGVQLRRRSEGVQRVLRRIPTWAVVSAVLLTALLGLAEARLLYALDRPYILNTLRLSNQVYSLAVFVLLLRVRVPLFPRWMDVGRHTFGLYLVHWIVLDGAFIVTARALGAFAHLPWTQVQDRALDLVTSSPLRLLLWLGLGAAVYGLSFAVTRALAAHSRWQRTVGARSVPARAPLAPAFGTDD